MSSMKVFTTLMLGSIVTLFTTSIYIQSPRILLVMLWMLACLGIGWLFYGVYAAGRAEGRRDSDT